MTKFRKKPVVIEAVQFWPADWAPHDEGASYPCGVRVNSRVEYGQPGRWYIHTLEGEMIVTPGDWIITGIKGERYPCKPDIFEATYEEVVE
jgi:hypothetical protein